MRVRPLFIAAVVAACGLFAPPLAAPAPAATLPIVEIDTSMGKIFVQIDTLHAPVTAKNFLKLVDSGLYNGTSFYRTVDRAREPSSIDVIQGGLGDHASPNTIPIEPTEKTGLHNIDGEISMARTSDPNSGSSEFFLCVGDNTALDSEKYSDRYGYAAFGHIVGGYAVVKRINAAPAEGETLTPPVKIIRMHRVAHMP